MSLAITVGAWVAVAAAANLGLAPAIGMSVLVVALAATALTVAHFAVFLARVRVVTEIRAGDGSVKPAVVQYSPDRRAFLARSLAGSVGALAAVLLGRAETAAAPATWCVYSVTFTNDCKGITVGSEVCLPCGASCDDYVYISCSKNSCFFQISKVSSGGCQTCPGGAVKLGKAYNCL